MTKIEFLTELDIALSGKIDLVKKVETIEKYSKVFSAEMDKGRSEDDISKELGSPAGIAKDIFAEYSDSSNKGNGPNEYEQKRNNEGGTKKEDFGNKFDEKTNGFTEYISGVDVRIKEMNLSSMGRRFAAYLIDGAIVGCVGLFASAILIIPFGIGHFFSNLEHFTFYSDYHGIWNIFSSIPGAIFSGFSILLSVLLLGAVSIFTALCIWITDGYTPGKALLRIRVVKLDKTKILFWDAFLRDIVIKSFANSLLNGLLNIGSFIWACATEDKKTVHDLAAKTRVVNVIKE